MIYIASALLTLSLLLAPCGCTVEPEPVLPIIGPAPCHSDTPWGCYSHRLYMPIVAAEVTP